MEIHSSPDRKRKRKEECKKERKKKRKNKKEREIIEVINKEVNVKQKKSIKKE